MTLLELSPVLAVLETWLRNIRRFCLTCTVKAPAQIGCLPTVYLIRKMTDNIFHNQLRHGGKHVIQ